MRKKRINELDATMMERKELRQGRSEEVAETLKDWNLNPKKYLTELPILALIHTKYHLDNHERYSSDDKFVNVLADIMVRTPQLPPIVVAEIDEGEFIVIDGWARVLAAKHIVENEKFSQESREKFKKMEALVYREVTTDEIADVSRFYNILSNAVPSLVKIRLFQHALNNNNLMQISNK